MKLSIILLLGLLCFGKSDTLTLVKATSYKWSSGVQGLHGIKYSFVFIAGTSSDKLSFTQVWVGEHKLDFKAFKFGKTAQHKKFEKNDTIIISCEHSINTKIEQEDISEQTVPEYKGEALIFYKVKKKEKRLIVDKIESGKNKKYQ